jgi:ABC-type uncharacterized transport system permease subunit
MWKRTSVKIISGFISFLAGAKVVLDYLGSADFIIERFHNPGWIGVAYNHVVSFSPEDNVIIFLLALGIFGIT